MNIGQRIAAARKTNRLCIMPNPPILLQAPSAGDPGGSPLLRPMEPLNISIFTSKIHLRDKNSLPMWECYLWLFPSNVAYFP